jgi:hypothetical protein
VTSPLSIRGNLIAANLPVDDLSFLEETERLLGLETPRIDIDGHLDIPTSTQTTIIEATHGPLIHNTPHSDRSNSDIENGRRPYFDRIRHSSPLQMLIFARQRCISVTTPLCHLVASILTLCVKFGTFSFSDE